MLYLPFERPTSTSGDYTAGRYLLFGALRKWEVPPETLPVSSKQPSLFAGSLDHRESLVETDKVVTEKEKKVEKKHRMFLVPSGTPNTEECQEVEAMRF